VAASPTPTNRRPLRAPAADQSATGSGAGLQRQHLVHVADEVDPHLLAHRLPGDLGG